MYWKISHYDDNVGKNILLTVTQRLFIHDYAIYCDTDIHKTFPSGVLNEACNQACVYHCFRADHRPGY
jgi:hypothetical protein